MVRGGAVVRLRVNPADVMTCIDLAKASGLVTQGMSLAAIISLALSGLCNGARAAGLAPAREGFEYQDMVQPFTQYKQGVKLDITKRAQQDMAQREMLDMQPKAAEMGRRVFDLNPVLIERKRGRFEELKHKREHNPLNFDEKDQAELDQLFDFIYELNKKEKGKVA